MITVPTTLSRKNLTKKRLHNDFSGQKNDFKVFVTVKKWQNFLTEEIYIPFFYNIPYMLNEILNVFFTMTLIITVPVNTSCTFG